MGTQARVDATMLASGGTRNALFPRSIATVGALMSLVSSVLISAMLYTYQMHEWLEATMGYWLVAFLASATTAMWYRRYGMAKSNTHKMDVAAVPAAQAAAATLVNFTPVSICTMDSNQLLRLSTNALQLEWSPLTCLQLTHIDKAWYHPLRPEVHISARGGMVLQLHFADHTSCMAWQNGLQALLSLAAGGYEQLRVSVELGSEDVLVGTDQATVKEPSKPPALQPTGSVDDGDNHTIKAVIPSASREDLTQAAAAQQPSPHQEGPTTDQPTSQLHRFPSDSLISPFTNISSNHTPHAPHAATTAPTGMLHRGPHDARGGLDASSGPAGVLFLDHRSKPAAPSPARVQRSLFASSIRRSLDVSLLRGGGRGVSGERMSPPELDMSLVHSALPPVPPRSASAHGSALFHQNSITETSIRMVRRSVSNNRMHLQRPSMTTTSSSTHIDLPTSPGDSAYSPIQSPTRVDSLAHTPIRLVHGDHTMQATPSLHRRQLSYGVPMSAHTTGGTVVGSASVEGALLREGVERSEEGSLPNGLSFTTLGSWTGRQASLVSLFPMQRENSMLSGPYPSQNLSSTSSAMHLPGVAGEEGSSEEGSTRRSRGGQSVPVEVLPYKDLAVGQRLGGGGQSEVYLCLLHDTPVAVKTTTAQEVDVHMRAGLHDNIVGMRGVVQDGATTMLVMEYCQKGTLDHYLKETYGPGPCDRGQLVRLLPLLRHVARGVYHLHTRSPPILHRDIKPSNIFISRGLTAKVGDFGMSRVLSGVEGAACVLERTLTTNVVGTHAYCAPELLTAHTPSHADQSAELCIKRALKADVYSFGVTMWESVERRNRFCREHYMNEHQIQWNWIYDADSMKLPDLTPHPSLVQAGGELLQGLNELVQACTVVDPDKRPSFRDVLIRLKALVQMSSAVGVQQGAPG